ncbi:acid type B receptor subunit 2 [Seminavis robusta]|uniref:Acid type B receptor subunit 2 n=1 Tax=Seminavis robusta TaxID=568900 RepID=A0A9N8HIC1_9STRA|nr:acid type B receptor subunit 2 [Seminavis robusta]|eukprot:Sro772_g200250.1 acid type B receptor subunit 2 (1123) ;mRNA; r:16943-20408
MKRLFLLLCCLIFGCSICSSQSEQPQFTFQASSKVDFVSRPSPTVSPTVTLILSSAKLLSTTTLGRCYDAYDDSCRGGIAALMAYARNNTVDSDIGRLVLPGIDIQSSFVQMHPLDWSVNRLILKDYFNFDVFWGVRSLTTQQFYSKERDLSDLQSNDFPLLASNLDIPISNTWKQFVKDIHFHEETGLAVMKVVLARFVTPENGNGDDDEEGILNELEKTIESCKSLLSVIHQINWQAGCLPQEEPTPYWSYMQSSALWTNLSQTSSQQQQHPGHPCWIPVIITGQGLDAPMLDPFVEALATYEKFPPAVIYAPRGKYERFATPGKVHNTWVYWKNNYGAEGFDQLRLHLRHDPSLPHTQNEVLDLTVTQDDTRNIDERVKDEQFVRDIEFLKDLMVEAENNDPLLGNSTEMPYTREGKVRRCYGGECPLGNLFTDAMRWRAQADVAVINSGGIRGGGWPAGEVRTSNIWASFFYANTLCEISMSGLSLFRLFNYSTSLASFEPRNIADGDRLFQVSGARITYNTELNTSRLISMEIWDNKMQDYKPVDRLKIYKVASSSWECDGFAPVPDYLTTALVMKGERPAEITDELIQNVVGSYLKSLNGTVYDTSIKGRLINDTDSLEAMDWIQTEESCPFRTYWSEEYLTCFDCPDVSQVQFAEETLDGEGVSGQDNAYPLQATVVNGENFTITLLPKQIPSWISWAPEGGAISSTSVTSRDAGTGNEDQVLLEPAQTHTFTFVATSRDLDAGIAQATVSFAVQDGGSYPGCSGDDVSFQVSMSVEPEPELSKPEGSRYAGFVLMAISCLMSISFGAWVYWNRNDRVVRSLQPVFLIGLCVGTFILCFSILPLSIVDELEKESARDHACQATPWLIVLGFNMIMSSLYAKLWRINKLFGGNSFARVAITARQAAIATSALFVTNLILLCIWTIVDPLKWEIRHVPGEEWNQYGSCTDVGPAGQGLYATIFVLTMINLVLASHQAFKARNISDEFSESTSLGFAVFTSAQIVIVGLPILFLISEDNPDAQYLLQTMMIFAISTSGLLLIFVPIILQQRERQQQPRDAGRVHVSGIAASTTHYSTTSAPVRGSTATSMPASKYTASNSTPSSDSMSKAGVSKELSS